MSLTDSRPEVSVDHRTVQTQKLCLGKADKKKKKTLVETSTEYHRGGNSRVSVQMMRKKNHNLKKSRTESRIVITHCLKCPASV